MGRLLASDDLITDEEVRRLLGVSRTTLWRLRREGRLPCGRAGRKYVYWKSEILDWVREGRGSQSSSVVANSAQAVREERPEYPRERARAGRTFYETKLGQIVLGDSLEVLTRKAEREPHSVDLIMTSPPFGLVRKKAYGNADASEYLEWFRPFARVFKRVLKDNGSLVIDLGGAWVAGQPTRSLYHLKLPIMLCEEVGFHLAQEFYWWNPSKLPTPAEWVTVRRIRVKDAMNCVWWLSPTPWPKASNIRVLQPYSKSMLGLLKDGYKPKLRPSGHDISDKFNRNNGAAIPPNLIAMANTESNGHYQRYCSTRGLTPHPARYPATLPEYFIRMLTDPGDLIVDPFAGSCVTGEVADRLGRNWLCIELEEDYLKGAIARFRRPTQTRLPLDDIKKARAEKENYYKVPRPGLLWNGSQDPPLDSSGGQRRRASDPGRSAKRAISRARKAKRG